MKKILSVIMALVTGGVSISLLGLGCTRCRSACKGMRETRNEEFIKILGALLSGAIGLTVFAPHDACSPGYELENFPFFLFLFQFSFLGMVYDSEHAADIVSKELFSSPCTISYYKR